MKKIIFYFGFLIFSSCYVQPVLSQPEEITLTLNAGKFGKGMAQIFLGGLAAGYFFAGLKHLNNKSRYDLLSDSICLICTTMVIKNGCKDIKKAIEIEGGRKLANQNK